MPYAENDGVRIHYETDGTAGAPPVIMHHGFLADLESWRARGYVDRLRDQYRILLMDARGHGLSDKPHEPEAYETRTRVLDVVAVLQAEGVQRAHYVGYSMGGMMGYSTLIYAPQRFASISVGGAHPMQDPGRIANRTADFDAYYQGALKRNAAVKAAFEAGKHDVAALKACRDEGARWGGAEQAVRMAQVPILIYAGTNDAPFEGAKRAQELNPRIRFLPLEGKDHAGAAEAVDQVAPAILETLALAERESPAR